MIEHALEVAQALGFDEIKVREMKENARALAFHRNNGFATYMDQPKIIHTSIILVFP